MTKRRIYLDHAATTPVLPEVAEAMQPYLSGTFGNPSSLHWFGQEARRAVDAARDTIARILGADSSEIYFTSGGTESDNQALLGVTTALAEKGNHIITSTIEHQAVLQTAKILELRGLDVTYINVNPDGLIDPKDIEKAIAEKTILISVMHANNEIGVIQPLAEIARIATDRDVPLHTDAVQTVGHIPVNVDHLGVDLLSLSAHKFYGPKGIGVLYIRRGTRIVPLIQGGSQERQRRAGTENVPAIVGMAKALEIAQETMEKRGKEETELRDYFITTLKSQIPNAHLNGHPVKRLPNNINISFPNAEGELLLLKLDMEGIAVSSGSACSSGAIDPSHVLKALGLPPELTQSSLRLTLGRSTTKAHLDQTLQALTKILPH